MAYSFRGSIAFGLVYIPVGLRAAVREKDISFNQIDKKTMSRVRYKKIRECDGREVRQEDIVKGFEYEKGKYVLFDDKDFGKLKTKKDKNITIEKFVFLSEVDPAYFGKAYHVVPTGAEKAFSVLLSAMEETGRAALAKTVLGTKETLILIRAAKNKMLLSTLYFADEIVPPPETAKEEGSEAERKMAKSVIEAMSGKFEPESYRDEYRERVMEAIEMKIAGKEITGPKETAGHSVKNLMDALEKSLSLNQTQAPKAKRGRKEAKKA